MFEYVLNKIKLFGHHGVYKREQSDGQYFYISIKYSVDDKDIKNDNNLFVNIDTSVVEGMVLLTGIVQNQDNQVISFYDYGRIMSPQDKMKFFKLGEIWWFESNRKIPINIFIVSLNKFNLLLGI